MKITVNYNTSTTEIAESLIDFVNNNYNNISVTLRDGEYGGIDVVITSDSEELKSSMFGILQEKERLEAEFEEKKRLKILAIDVVVMSVFIIIFIILLFWNSKAVI